MIEPGSGKDLLPAMRRLVWLAAIALAGVWVGLGFVPNLASTWLWFARAAIFFIGAAVMWFAYDTPSEDSGG